jgi:hypothetical protein
MDFVSGFLANNPLANTLKDTQLFRDDDEARPRGAAGCYLARRPFNAL